MCSFFRVYRYCYYVLSFFFFNDTATTEIYTVMNTLSLHDALPISCRAAARGRTARAVTEQPKTTKILLVCTGNICRSPLAAALLQRALTERGVEGMDVSSAGTGAWDGAPVSEGAYLVGLERGLDLSGHRARLLTRELVDGADLILTMARHHRARVDELGGEGHVFVLGEYAGREGDEAEVSDPFGGNLEVYRDTCVELEALLQTAVERIVKEFASGSQR